MVKNLDLTKAETFNEITKKIVELGRTKKQGRKGDVEETIINAAPDSVLANRSALEVDMSFALETGENIILTQKRQQSNSQNTQSS